jgi:hypothetical protein
MAEWITCVVRIRTTRDGGGRACGIVIGMGDNPQQALHVLRSEAERLAQQAAPEAQEVTKKADPELPEYVRARLEKARDPHNPSPRRVAARPLDSSGRPVEPGNSGPGTVALSTSGPREWRFEVVDVRLTQDGGGGWLAYGTLALELP